MKKLLMCVLAVFAFCGVANAKNLIVYFSQNGNTQRLADVIYTVAGGDMVRIEPMVAYPTDTQELSDLAKQEQAENARPSYKDLSVNMDDYDVVYVGYPIWHGDMPMILYTFFDNNDLSGKTVKPFITYGSSGESGTVEVIKTLEPNAVVVDALAVPGADSEQQEVDLVQEWVQK